MIKLYAIVAFVLIGLFGALGYGLYEAGGRIAELKEQNNVLTNGAKRAQEQANLDRKVLVIRQAQIASQARKLTQAQYALVEALQRNKSWSDTDVPIEVQKLLSGPSDGLPEPSSGVQ